MAFLEAHRLNKTARTTAASAGSSPARSLRGWSSSCGPQIQEIADELIDRAEASGGMDLVDFSFPLPITVRRPSASVTSTN
jgi:hypothetical protein